MPRVDILMATRNRTNLLDRAIASAISQTFEDWNLIVIDDASADSTWWHLQWWSTCDRRIRIHRNPTNIGPGASKRPHEMASTADYLATLDDDDWWTPDSLEERVKVMDTNPHCPLCYGDCWRVDEESNIRYWDSSKGKPFPNILPIAWLMRRDIFQEIGGWDPQFNLYHGEVDYYYRLGGWKKFIHIPKPLAYSTVTADAMSRNRKANADALELIVRKHWKEISADKKQLALYYARIGLHLAEAHEPAKKSFSRAIKVYPVLPDAWAGLLLPQPLFLRVYKLYRRLMQYDTRVYGTMD